MLHLPETLLARLAICHGLEKWELLAVVAKKLADWNPNEPGFFVELAYATRRAESIHAAHAILTRAAGLHPTDATIQFNLACYEAQLGNLDGAKAHFTRATEIDVKFGRMTLDGPDLEPLWDSLATEQGAWGPCDPQKHSATAGNPSKARASSSSVVPTRSEFRETPRRRRTAD
jgi:tetratricopeptide (TPR) repeat protein